MKIILGLLLSMAFIVYSAFVILCLTKKVLPFEFLYLNLISLKFQNQLFLAQILNLLIHFLVWVKIFSLHCLIFPTFSNMKYLMNMFLLNHLLKFYFSIFEWGFGPILK